MKQIEIDEQLFEFLQKNAKPFIDTPNSVLRRLLRIGSNELIQEGKHKTDNSLFSKHSAGNVNEFLQQVLNKEFNNNFTRKQPYRFMFESDEQLVYVQNFNKESPTLWYRVTNRPLKNLRDSAKKSYICLTNPAEKIAYLIPVEEIEKQVAASDWDRDYLEINIDHTSNRWKELNWNIKHFLKRY
jgi:hypothetical protein